MFGPEYNLQPAPAVQLSQFRLPLQHVCERLGGCCLAPQAQQSGGPGSWRQPKSPGRRGCEGAQHHYKGVSATAFTPLTKLGESRASQPCLALLWKYTPQSCCPLLPHHAQALVQEQGYLDYRLPGTRCSCSCCTAMLLPAAFPTALISPGAMALESHPLSSHDMPAETGDETLDTHIHE